METDATYRGTVYPWQCDHVGHVNIMWYVGKFDAACEFVGVHMDRQARKSTPFAPAIRIAAEKHLEPAMA